MWLCNTNFEAEVTQRKLKINSVTSPKTACFTNTASWTERTLECFPTSYERRTTVALKVMHGTAEMEYSNMNNIISVLLKPVALRKASNVAAKFLCYYLWWRESLFYAFLLQVGKHWRNFPECTSFKLPLSLINSHTAVPVSVLISLHFVCKLRKLRKGMDGLVHVISTLHAAFLASSLSDVIGQYLTWFSESYQILGSKRNVHSSVRWFTRMGAFLDLDVHSSWFSEEPTF